MVKKGDIVKIVDDGCLYSTFEDMAKKLKAIRWEHGKDINEGSHCRVINYGPHLEDNRIIIYLLQDVCGQQFLFDRKGFIVVENEPNKTEKEEKPMAQAPSLTERIKGAGKKVTSSQGAMAQTALTLEGARILNNQLVKIAAKKLPMMVRGYADTALGKAILANLLLMGIETALPDLKDTDPRKQIAKAAVVVSYQEFLQTFKAEEMLEELFSNASLKKLTDKLAASGEADEE